MRVMVTGGAGFVGSHMVDRLVARGDDVLVVDDLSTGSASNLPPGVELEEMDVASPRLLDVASAWRPEAVCHAAAQPSVPVSMSDPLLDAHTNVMGGLNVLRAAMEAGAAQVVYVNTGGALYGEPDYLPCDEDHPQRPLSPYGLSKLTMERYFRLMLPPSVTLKVLRLSNVYGPRQSAEGESGVISIFIRRMLRGEPVTIDGDGLQTRDFVYVGDVAAAHELVIDYPEPLTANIGTGSGVSVNELFEVIADLTGYERSPQLGPPRLGDVKHVVLEVTRARERLGWTATTSLADGLRKTVAAMRQR